MIVLIHGDDTRTSRKYFMDLYQKAKEPVLLDGEAVDMTSLHQIFSGGSLFGEENDVFIESFLTKSKKKSEFSSLVSFLHEQKASARIYLWESKELEKSTLSLFKSDTIKPFKLPQTLFTFLDALSSGNGKRLTLLFHQTIAITEPELVFFMLIRHFRIFLGLHGAGEQIDEIKRIAPWQKSKLEKQAKSFSFQKLKRIYHTLYELDLAQKTGGLTLSLPAHIDFLLLEI